MCVPYTFRSSPSSPIEDPGRPVMPHSCHSHYPSGSVLLSGEPPVWFRAADREKRHVLMGCNWPVAACLLPGVESAEADIDPDQRPVASDPCHPIGSANTAKSGRVTNRAGWQAWAESRHSALSARVGGSHQAVFLAFTSFVCVSIACWRFSAHTSSPSSTGHSSLPRGVRLYSTFGGTSG